MGATLILATLALPASAIANEFAPAGYPRKADRRVGVSLTVPLGGAREARDPQLELRAVADHRAARIEAGEGGPLGWLPNDRAREARIGVTLAHQPRLTVAGRQLPEHEHKLGISTAGWVAIGVAAVAVVGGVLLVERITAASD
jgi:hypothetical protein